MLLMRLAPEGMYHAGARAATRAPRARPCIQFLCHGRARDAKMFGTLTLIKRNGSEGSTMTMDSRETTIGR